MWQWSLFAVNGNVVRALERHRQRNFTLDGNSLLLFGLVSIAVLLLLIFVLERFRRARGETQPVRRVTLFQQLCKAHTLSAADAGLVARAAQAAGVAEPGIAFVDPAVLERYAAQCPEGERAACGDLRKRLFGALDEEEARPVAG